MVMSCIKKGRIVNVGEDRAVNVQLEAVSAPAPRGSYAPPHQGTLLFVYRLPKLKSCIKKQNEMVNVQLFPQKKCEISSLIVPLDAATHVDK
jgi:hypothetical protein